MAKILSHVWSTIRGSVGGITYTTNQWGQIIARIRTAPVNPATELQELFRTSFEASNQNWRHLLTVDQREHWHDYARNITFNGGQGNYKINGREMFMRSIALQRYLFARGLRGTIEDPDAPPIQELPTVGPWTWSIPLPGETGFIINFTNINVTAGQFMGEISQPFPFTRRRFKGPFNGATMQLSDDVQPSNTGTIKWTGLLDVTAYFVKVRFMPVVTLPQSLSTAAIGRQLASANPAPNGADGLKRKKS